MDKDIFTEGTALLKEPIMPLVSMVQFLFMTGPFSTVAEVVKELPEPIETDRTTYDSPQALLAQYLDILAGFEQLKEGSLRCPVVIDEQNNSVDPFTAGGVLIQQQLLEAELEKINSLLCGPCGCTLCCIGPDKSMEQEFFEIPLGNDEIRLFPVDRFDTDASRSSSPLDDTELQVKGKPFYRIDNPALFHWQKGWSLILPKESTCPSLTATGQCRVYSDRPLVCRRPQIFPYMLEPVEGDAPKKPVMRIRQTLLAVIDCPYVQVLKDEVAEYAAASELHLVIKQNKQ